MSPSTARAGGNPAPGSAASRAGAGLALVCVDRADRQLTVRTALERLGYTPEVPADARAAIGRLRRAVYAVAVVDEGYGGAAPSDDGVLRALDALPMAVRRDIFVVLVGDGLATGDRAMAFARSANVVVNARDLGQLAAVLERAFAENDAFYRVFREVLAAVGRR